MQIFMVTYDVKTFDLEKKSSLISLGIGILRPKSGGGGVRVIYKDIPVAVNPDLTIFSF